VRARAGLLPLVVAVAATLLLAGCGAGDPTRGADPSPSASPRVGGSTSPRTSAPGHAMDKLEKQVAARLAGQVAHQDLTLEYLDCPHWNGVVPSRMVCRAYVDGLVAKVRVLLKAGEVGTRVSFDAMLADGLIATRSLEDTLREQGWDEVDCGSAPAYPAVVGARIVCRVARDDARSRYVEATVTSRGGAVSIQAYRPRSTDG
jgi:hypothetical protein